MLTVHHLRNSRSQRIVWLLEELELDYSIVFHEHPASTRQSSESLLGIHPLGKAPVLCDGELVVAESGAIVDYVTRKYARNVLTPATDEKSQLADLYWRHFAEGSLMPYLAMKLVFAGIRSRTPWLLRPATYPLCWAVNRFYLNPNLFAELDFIEAHLAHNSWFSGEHFTGADILMAFPLEAVSGRLATADRYPAIASFVARARERPAYRRASVKGEWSMSEHDKYWAFLKG